MVELPDYGLIRDKLIEQKAQLQERIAAEKGGGDAEVFNPDRSDLAQDYASQERRVALLACLEESLEQVEAAIQRLDEGTYGRCERCGEPIPPERLHALPVATMCVRCKGLLHSR